MHTIVKFLSLNICYVIYVLLWIKYWLMWFEILLVFILFKFKKYPNIFGIRVVYILFQFKFFSPKLHGSIVCLTYKTEGASAEFSSVYLSTLLWRSWNMMDPLLLFRFSSSIITSLGTLIFFPRFRPSHTHTLALVTLVSFILDLCQVFYSMDIIFIRVFGTVFIMVLNDYYYICIQLWGQ